jgi:hypothetical protein
MWPDCAGELMEPRLAQHKATPNPQGNHFSRVDQAARQRIGDGRPSWDAEAERERENRYIQAVLTNARTAGRAMARYAEFLKRRDLAYCTERDVVEQLTTPGSIWMQQQWHKELVDPICRDYAHAYMLKVLRERGWRL